MSEPSKSGLGLEQDRRDFKAKHPVVYDYIAALEAAKVLDSLGDRFSSMQLDEGGHEAANVAWSTAARFTDRAKVLRGG